MNSEHRETSLADAALPPEAGVPSLPDAVLPCKYFEVQLVFLTFDLKKTTKSLALSTLPPTYLFEVSVFAQNFVN